METERFEAFVDAIYAIIITLIVLEFNLPAEPTLAALFDLKLYFIAYAVSFLIVFNVWNIHHNLFMMIDKLDSRVIWSSMLSVFFMTFLPYLTVFVSENFHSFVAQASFGLVFILCNLEYLFSTKFVFMPRYSSNTALMEIFEKGIKNAYIDLVIFIISFILGYLFYPSIIMLGCVLDTIIWSIPDRFF